MSRAGISRSVLALALGMATLWVGSICRFPAQAAEDEKKADSKAKVETKTEESKNAEKRPPHQPAVAKSPEHPHHESSIEEKIRQSPSDVEFIDTPLEDALKFLQDKHKIKIWLDKAAISDEGVATNTPMTLQLDGITLGSVLNLLLEPLALDWVIQDEVLKVTARWKAAKIFETHVYDIKALLDHGYTRNEVIDSVEAGVAAELGRGAGGQGTIQAAQNTLVIRQNQRAHSMIERVLISLEVSAEAEKHFENLGDGPVVLRAYRVDRLDADEVADALQEILEPDSWEDAGGKGTIRTVKGDLFVRQTPKVHKQLQRLLADLSPPPPASEKKRAGAGPAKSKSSLFAPPETNGTAPATGPATSVPHDGPPTRATLVPEAPVKKPPPAAK